VGGHDDQRAVAGAGAHAHDIADPVHLHIVQPVRPEHLEIGGRAHRLVKWRRGNFRERDDVRDRSVMLARQCRGGGGE
jgi:hypothetical protein